MKATKFFAMVAALLAVGCTNEIIDDSIEQNTEGVILTLNGDAQAEEAESRIIVDGSKTGGKYNVKWRNDDAVGLFSADGTTINNVKADEKTIESGKTSLTASFETTSAVAAKTGDEILVYYPYSASTTYANGKFSGNLAASQETNDLTVSYGFAPYTFAYDVATVGEGSVKFALEHPLAYVKVVVEQTTYVENWKLKGVQIVDRTGAAKLAGNYTVDTATGALTVTNGTSSVDQYFRVVKNTIANSENYSSRYITLVTLPWDFTGSEVWVVAKFEDPTTGGMIYVPTKYENAKLKGGAWNIIKLNLTAENNSVKGWYEPVDTRMMPVLGYAYGDQNTYLIQCKNGSTYNGATYTPNADIPSSVKVDIRGRGDFSKVVDVTKATFAWFKKGLQTDGNGSGAVYVGTTANYDASKVDPTKYTIDDSTKAQGYITVTNTGAYAGSPILLMIVDGKVVWSWYFWNIAADGTTLKGVDVGDGTQMANMLVGQPTTNYNTWGSNLKKGTTDPDPIYRFIACYQWGRTMPHFWTSYPSIDPGDGSGNNGKDLNMPWYKTETAVTLAEAIARPVGFIAASYPTQLTTWCSEDITQLWGANGVKSVYDPCPKGWKVPASDVYKYMKENGTITYYSDTSTEYEYFGAPGLLYGSEIVCVAAGYHQGYVASNGRLQPQGTGVYLLGKQGWGGAWTNSFYNGNPIRSCTGTSARKQFDTSSNNSTLSVNLRCQKDTDNR